MEEAYPLNLLEFEDRFSAEARCIEYLPEEGRTQFIRSDSIESCTGENADRILGIRKH